jgi:hypothetical protein
VFEDKAMRRIFGPKRDEVTGGWIKLHIRDLHSSPSIIRIIKSRKMRWAGHVARMGKRGTRRCCWWESQTERVKEDEIGVEWIILRWIFER